MKEAQQTSESRHPTEQLVFKEKRRMKVFVNANSAHFEDHVSISVS
jgi:hypothetical protein